MATGANALITYDYIQNLMTIEADKTRIETLIDAASVAANLFTSRQLADRAHTETLDGNGLAVISNAGFEAVGMADAIKRETAELRMVDFSAETSQTLQAALARHHLDGLVDVKNPLDVTPMATDAAFADLIRAMLHDSNVHALVAGMVPLTPAMQTLPEGPAHKESLDSPGSIARILPEISADSIKNKFKFIVLLPDYKTCSASQDKIRL